MTISEIAKLAGVSTSTVSKIINNKALNIHPETRERVLRIVKEYNYTPYGMAKSASVAKTFLIAVLLRHTDKANQLIRGIVRTAQEHGYSVLIYDSNNDLQTELKHITSICSKNADGVLWEPVSVQSADYCHYLSERSICFSYLNSSSQIDFIKMGYALTQNLIDFRHSRIACLMKEHSHRSELVLEGYRKCLYDNQITYDPHAELFITDPECCTKIMTSNITGIISSHYTSALSIYEQLNRLHYNIPSDFSLVSLKNDISGTETFPHISGIRIPYIEFGSYVCGQLIEKCEKKESMADSGLYSPAILFSQEGSVDVPISLRKKKIVVVGSINIDTIFNVSFLPQSGKTTPILNSTVTLGGKGANQAIGSVRLGSETSLIAEIGNDPDSSFVINTLNNEKLSTQNIFRDMNSQTGKAFIYIKKDAESAITVLAGANANLSPNQIRQRQHLFKNAGYCLLSTEIPAAATVEAARIARECGAKNIVKPAVLNQFPTELIPYTDIFVPNRKEAAALCPGHMLIKEQADYFLSQGFPTVIITLGHEGCYLRTADCARFFPAINVTAVDTTGGADSFISALASYLTEGCSLETSIQIALCAASFCVTRQGVAPALVDKTTLEAYINRVNPELLTQKSIVS